MSRTYIQLECGCLISCDGGGGLIPCDYDENPNCKSREYMDEHKSCSECGECVICYCECNSEIMTIRERRKLYGYD